MVGRRSTGIAQTLGLDGDDYVSRRHVLFVRQTDGSYVVRLFDNTNGGTLNGTELAPGVEQPVKVGDRLTIGTYTVIRVTAIR